MTRAEKLRLAVVLAAMLLLMGNLAQKPELAAAPYHAWQHVKAALHCTGLVPPECVEPLPGL